MHRIFKAKQGLLKANLGSKCKTRLLKARQGYLNCWGCRGDEDGVASGRVLPVSQEAAGQPLKKKKQKVLSRKVGPVTVQVLDGQPGPSIASGGVYY